MNVKYYPGCTLKSKAKNLETAALASLKALDVDMEEIERWNCCGAVYSLAEDDLIHKVAPVRNLIRVQEQGGNKVVTLCAMCYNTLARANELMRSDEEKRDTINRFMDEEIDYFGEVEVIHLLNYLRDEIGWDTIRQKVTRPLEGLKVAPYYGCTLQRPADIAIEPAGSFALMSEFIEALGGTAVAFREASFCCGSYQVLGNPDAAGDATAVVVNAARSSGADLISTSCPLCEYNLGKKQDGLIEQKKIERKVPTLYFTQLLAIALGLPEETYSLELNDPTAASLLQAKSLVAV